MAANGHHYRQYSRSGLWKANHHIQTNWGYFSKSPVCVSYPARFFCDLIIYCQFEGRSETW